MTFPHVLRSSSRLTRRIGIAPVWPPKLSPYSHFSPVRYSSSQSKLDQFILTSLTAHFARPPAPLPECSYAQYRQNAHTVLDAVLPSEPYPSATRRADGPVVDAGGDGLVLVVHASAGKAGVDYTVCSGFLVRAEGSEGVEERYVVTCAHTLEEIEHRHPSSPKQTFVLPSTASPSSPSQPTLLPIPGISTSLPRSDILILRLPSSAPSNIRTLPISPYPIYRGQDVLVHFFGAPEPPIPRVSTIVQDRAEMEGLGEEDHAAPVPWAGGMGWRRWVKGRMLGYRGYSWREVEPGTADSLPFILTSPLPSPGSSGGPILDAQSGAVVGIISGTRMDNRVEGERGWGASAENVFELFSLAGFSPSSKRKSPT